MYSTTSFMQHEYLVYNRHKHIVRQAVINVAIVSRIETSNQNLIRSDIESESKKADKRSST